MSCLGSYGRRTEKSSEIPHQMEFCFNEAEVLITDATKEQLEEPTVEEIISSLENTDTPKQRKSHAKGSREEMLKDIPHEERGIHPQAGHDQMDDHGRGALLFSAV